MTHHPSVSLATPAAAPRLGSRRQSPGLLRPEDLIPAQHYAATRAVWRQAMRLRRQRRRVALGPHCSLLFENRLTVQAQIQEVLHLEAGPCPSRRRMQQEINAYAPLLARPGDICATLFVQPASRTVGDQLCQGMADGRLGVALRIGQRHVLAHCHRDVDDLDPVKYLRFSLDGPQRQALARGAAAAALLLGPRLTAVQPLPLKTRLELAADLAA